MIRSCKKICWTFCLRLRRAQLGALARQEQERFKHVAETTGISFDLKEFQVVVRTEGDSKMSDSQIFDSRCFHSCATDKSSKVHRCGEAFQITARTDPANPCEPASLCRVDESAFGEFGRDSSVQEHSVSPLDTELCVQIGCSTRWLLCCTMISSQVTSSTTVS